MSIQITSSVWAAFTQGLNCSCSQQLLPNQMMCSSCHMNTVCKQCDREREGEGQRECKKERPPQALLLLASPGIFWVKLFADSLWFWIPRPAAADRCHPPTRSFSRTPTYAMKHPRPVFQGWREGEGNKIKNSTVWHESWQQLTGGNTTPFSTRFAAHSTQMESGLGERERTDGQTHKQRADSTPRSQSQSHCRELGSRAWRGNDNTLRMPLIV